MENAPQGHGAGLPSGSGAYLLGRILDGRYSITSLLGVGGMGTVYRAEQFSMHRDVAVKVVRQDLQNENSVRRFLTEARAASRLKSPHTVTVFDFGRTADDILFIAMELLEGCTLAAALRDEGKPFELGRAAGIINQVLNSMEEAHGLGILHRDLKPDNVFLLDIAGSRDFLKVLDFGVAKMLGDTPHGTTVTGVSFGTPIYMSPEQMMGRKLGPSTDLYSVAIMLFELLAGSAPLEGLSPVENAMKKIEAKIPTLREVNPEVQAVEGLDAFLQRALAPDPANRPPDVKTFRAEFEQVVRNARARPEPAPVPARPISLDRPDAPTPSGTVRGVPVVTIEHPARLPRLTPRSASHAAARPAAQPEAPPDVAAPEATPQAFRGKPLHPPVPVRRIEAPPAPRTPPPPAPLQPPKPSRAAERRVRPRMTRLSSVVCMCADGGRHKALVAEASESGGYLYCQWLPTLGDNVSILFRPSDEAVGPAIIIVARVVRIVDTPATAGGVRGFSVKWLVLRTQGRMTRLQTFYKSRFGVELPATSAHAEARLWEFWFETRILHRDVVRRNGA